MDVRITAGSYVIIRYGRNGEQFAQIERAVFHDSVSGDSQLVQAKVWKFRTNSLRWTKRSAKIAVTDILRRAEPADFRRFRTGL